MKNCGVQTRFFWKPIFLKGMHEDRWGKRHVSFKSGPPKMATCKSLSQPNSFHNSHKFSAMMKKLTTTPWSSVNQMTTWSFLLSRDTRKKENNIATLECLNWWQSAWCFISTTRQVLPRSWSLCLVKSIAERHHSQGRPVGIGGHRLHSLHASHGFHHNYVHYQHVFFHLYHRCRCHLYVLHH